MKNALEQALEVLNNHEVIAFPTETVYGLGVFYDDEKAYHLLNAIKRRKEDKPYTMMLDDINKINEYAVLSEKYLPLVKKFMPGPLTILLKSKENVPSYVTHNTGVIGIRIPENKEALELLKYVKKPLLVPSANRRDEKPALNDQEVKAIFGDEIKAIIKGKAIGGQPSTIIDLTGAQIKIVREGPISLEELTKLINN